MSKISCPSCNAPIAVNTNQFLQGTTFSCSNCSTTLGIEEKTDLNQDKLDLFKKFTKTKKEKTQVIPCPDCGTGIPFNVKELLAGKAVSCSQCKASVALQS